MLGDTCGAEEKVNKEVLPGILQIGVRKGGVTSFKPRGGKRQGMVSACSFLPSRFRIVFAYGRAGELNVDFATTEFIKHLQAAGTVLDSGDCPRFEGSDSV